MSKQSETKPEIKTTAYIAYKKFGIHKSTATYINNNFFTIPHEYHDLFQTYFLLKWEKEYFAKNRNHGTITRNGVSYCIILHHCTMYDIMKLYCDDMIRLSFRQLDETYNFLPTVLVSIDKEYNSQRKRT